MPGEIDSILNEQATISIFVYLVAALEYYLQKPTADSVCNVVNIHESSGFCVFRGVSMKNLKFRLSCIQGQMR